MDEELIKFRRFQKRVTKACARYRNGDLDARYEMHRYPREEIDRRPHPAVKDRKDIKHKVYHHDQAAALEELRKTMNICKYRVNKRHSMSDLQGSNRAGVKNKINIVSRRLFKAGIRFRRILSCGGMGMAALFETANSTTGLYNKCVAKITLSSAEGKDMKHEKNMTSMMSGAPHIVQMLTIDQLRALPGGYVPEAIKGEMPDDPAAVPKVETDEEIKKGVHDSDDVMILEYLPFGSLDHWIAKADQLDIGFSNEVCWHLLLCLGKACLAMKYPTACQPEDLPVETDLDSFVLPKKDPVSDIQGGVSLLGLDRDSDGRDDDVGGGVQLKPSAELHDVVHFDLDPQNILVDDWNTGCGTVCPTANIPKLKVADFGLAVDASTTDMTQTNWAWKRRLVGKTAFLAPEQWTAEWDIVEDGPEAGKVNIAGQYGEKTNIYQVGLILQSIMLRKKVDDVPRPAFVFMRNLSHPDFPRHLDDPFEFATATTDAVKNKTLPDGIVTIPTIAWLLNHESLRAEYWNERSPNRRSRHPKPSMLYEWQLREMVMRCAAYEPHLRPSAAELVQLAEARLDAGNFGDGGAGAAEAERLFSEANKPAEPQPKWAYDDEMGAVSNSGAIRRRRRGQKPGFNVRGLFGDDPSIFLSAAVQSS